jgi:hypothetical protein
MRVLHLFNVFGATTEKAMLDYTVALRARGWDVVAGYERLDDASRARAVPLVQLQRVPVGSTDDVPAQMRRVASSTSRSTSFTATSGRASFRAPRGCCGRCRS